MKLEDGGFFKKAAAVAGIAAGLQAPENAAAQTSAPTHVEQGVSQKIEWATNLAHDMDSLARDPHSIRDELATRTQEKACLDAFKQNIGHGEGYTTADYRAVLALYIKMNAIMAHWEEQFGIEVYEERTKMLQELTHRAEGGKGITPERVMQYPTMREADGGSE